MGGSLKLPLFFFAYFTAILIGGLFNPMKGVVMDYGYIWYDNDQVITLDDIRPSAMYNIVDESMSLTFDEEAYLYTDSDAIEELVA